MLSRYDGDDGFIAYTWFSCVLMQLHFTLKNAFTRLWSGTGQIIVPYFYTNYKSSTSVWHTDFSNEGLIGQFAYVEVSPYRTRIGLSTGGQCINFVSNKYWWFACFMNFGLKSCSSGIFRFGISNLLLFKCGNRDTI